MDEDAYGVVQRDVPRILESFVSLLSALETFSQEVQKDVSEARSELLGDDVLKWYLEHRQQKEGETISEMIGPLLSGKHLYVVLMPRAVHYLTGILSSARRNKDYYGGIWPRVTSIQICTGRCCAASARGRSIVIRAARQMNAS